MRFHDISVPLSPKTPTYPGDPGIEIQAWASLQKGDSANVSLLHFGAHSGTHVDAPAHFIDQAGKVDAMSLDHLIGEAIVVEVPVETKSIDETFINHNVPADSQRVLFKTRNSELWAARSETFATDYVYLEPEAAHRLVALGLKLVGIDYLSIEKFKTDSHPAHVALLAEGIVILEGLNLAKVTAGKYELICLPLKIAGGAGDGAPARAVLREL